MTSEMAQISDPNSNIDEIKLKLLNKKSISKNPKMLDQVLISNTINEYFKAKDIKQREKIFINNIFESKSYLANLFSAYVNIEFGNISGASIYLKKLINIPPRFLALDIQDLTTEVKKQLLKENILKMLVKVWDSEINEHLKNLFFDSLVELEDAEIGELQSGFLGDLLKTKTKFSMDDYRYSISFPNVWFQKINDEDKEQTFLHSFFNSPAFYDIQISEFGIFSVATPSDLIRRNYILSKLSNEWKKYEYYEQEAILSALENPVFRKEIIKMNNFYNIPLFNFKKNVFKENFEHGNYRIYSILKLFELGHEDEEMLSYLL